MKKLIFTGYTYSKGHYQYSKTCLKRPLIKKTKIGFQDQLLLNAGQKYCRMLQREHSAIRLISLSYPLSLRHLFYIFVSGRLRQGFLYLKIQQSLYIFTGYTYSKGRAQLEKGCWQLNCECFCNGTLECPSDRSEWICGGRPRCTRCQVEVDGQNYGSFEPKADFQITVGLLAILQNVLS